tara:strand:- start:242 stop:496 length:255 start_codon:yes stop_codon:yes gene_type:complete
MIKNYDPRDFYDDSNWKQEIRGYTSNQFELKLLEEGAKSHMQGIYLGSLYCKWKKIKGYDKYDPIENEGQLQSSFLDFEKKVSQ